MPVSFYLEVVAIVTHFIYGIIYWAYEGGGNINEEIAVPVLTFMFWLIAILYLGALVAAVVQGSVKTVIGVILLTVIGVGIVQLIVAIGIVMATVAFLFVLLLWWFAPSLLVFLL